MNRRITITTLLCLIGLWSAAASADKINPPPAVEINQTPPAQPPKLPPGTLPTELPKPSRIDSSGGNTAERTRQLEEDGLQPGPKRGKSGSSAVTSIVSDRVVKTGSKISGGWREYAADKSWRRAVFILDREAATIIFSDGKPGRRPPSMTQYVKYAKSGPGIKGSPVTYHEVRTFADATPAIRDKANQSSLIPADVATRIHELGGDIKVMQQMADLKRMGELKNAFDTMRNPTADGGFFPGRPGGSPGEGNWSNPRRGVGRDGRASDGTKPPDYDGGPKSADRVNTGNGEIRNADNTTITFTSWSDPDGNHGNSETYKDASGNITGGSGESVNADGDRTTTAYVRDPRTGERTFYSTTVYHDGLVTEISGTQPDTPSETPYSSRGGFDDAWLARSLPWLMDANYLQWKRENDLVKSGGRISQPGRGVPTLVLNEGPEVGANGVVNCGDSNTNPCARAAGVTVDRRRGFGNISQPGRGGEPGAPTGPRPIPSPEPQ